MSQRLPQDLVPKVTRFVITTRRLQLVKQYPLCLIGNMDETPMWLDMPGEMTVTHTGDRFVPVRTTGHKKRKIHCCSICNG